MNISCDCPKCHATIRAEVSSATESIRCDGCGLSIDIPSEAIVAHDDSDHLAHCLVCPSRELFIRKDFPQRLGILIVVVGFALSTVAWYYSQPLWTYAILFVTAGIDVLLYATMGEALVCYRCNAHYRGVENLDDHTGFNLETHERYRQLAARQQESATAHAPAGSAEGATSPPNSR